ncbi:hypothetical protein RI367_005586 [Sorochytrium milnesiophthora]
MILTAYTAGNIALCICILVIHAHSCWTARRAFRRRSLSAWLSSTCLASFLSGATGALVTLFGDLLQLAGSPAYQTLAPSLIGWIATCVLLQMYLQAIVILQRVHLVNAYKIDSTAITLHEFLIKRWPELVVTALAIALAAMAAIPVDPKYTVPASIAWLLFIIAMDLVLSVLTVNKVHRMLNTKEDAVSWAWSALRPRRHPPATPGQPTANDDRDSNVRRFVRTWLLLTCSILFTAVAYTLSWVQSNPYIYTPVIRLAWVCASVWQRGTMLHMEVVKHILLANRKSKQFLGTATKSGIQTNTVHDDEQQQRASPTLHPLTANVGRALGKLRQTI